MNTVRRILLLALLAIFGLLVTGTEAKAQVNVTASLSGDNSGIQATEPRVLSINLVTSTTLRCT